MASIGNAAKKVRMKDGSLVGFLSECLKAPQVEIALKGLVLVGMKVLGHENFGKGNLVVNFKGIPSGQPGNDVAIAIAFCSF